MQADDFMTVITVKQMHGASDLGKTPSVQRIGRSRARRFMFMFHLNYRV